MNPDLIAQFFHGHFVVAPDELLSKLERCKAFVFDWDGVFNDGRKDEYGSSTFSEVDSMGSNMLRFNHYLRKGNAPVTGIITGERNNLALSFARREHFHSIYCGIKYKPDALRHFCKTHHLEPDEVAFFFDDLIDFAVAGVTGLRLMIGRSCSPLLLNFAETKGLVDYVSSCEGGNGGLRECTELLTGISGRYDETLTHRFNFTPEYHAYLQERNEPVTLLYEQKDAKIVERSSL